MKLIRMKCGDADYFYNIYTRKNSGQEIKLDSLNQNELNNELNSRYSPSKYSNIIVQRSDGNTVHYDSVNGEWVKSKTEKRAKL